MLASLFFPFSSAQSFEETQTLFNEIKEEYDSLQEVGIVSQRINNTLDELNQSIRARRGLEERNETVSWQPIQGRLGEVQDVLDIIVIANDEIESARLYLETLDDEGNYSNAVSYLESAEEQFDLERYELVEENIESFYEEVSRIQSRSAAGSLLDNTATTVQDLISMYGVNVLLFFVVSGILLFAFKKPLATYYFDRGIDRLEMEKDVLRDLIRENQDNYFNKNSISQTTYDTRNKQYKELLRESTRQIYNLQEKKEKL